MKRLIAALILSCVAGYAAAETVSWTMPTANADGSAIPATGDAALKLTEIQIGSCTGTVAAPVFGTVQTTLRPLAPIVSQAWNPTLGIYCLRARVQNNALENSNWSALLRYQKTAPKPGTVVIRITVP